MNIDQFLDEQVAPTKEIAPIQEVAPAGKSQVKVEEDTIANHLAKMRKYLAISDAQHALEAFMRLHDAIMRDHEAEHNPAHHKLLSQAKNELKEGLALIQAKCEQLVTRLYGLVASASQACLENNTDLANKKYNDAKQLFEGFPTGFEHLKEQAQIYLLKIHTVLRQRRMELQKHFHLSIVSQLNDAIVKAKQALQTNQLDIATMITVKAHQLYAQLPAGFVQDQTDALFSLIALDYQVKMRTTLSELTAYAQLYQMPPKGQVESQVSFATTPTPLKSQVVVTNPLQTKIVATQPVLPFQKSMQLPIVPLPPLTSATNTMQSTVQVPQKTVAQSQKDKLVLEAQLVSQKIAQLKGGKK